MAKNEVSDEWIEWFKDLFKWLWIILKWAFKILIGLIILFFIIQFICMKVYEPCKNGISFKVGQIYYKMDNQLV